VKLAEHNRIKLIWVPEHNGNEVADQLARQGSSHPLTGPEPALDISAKVARGWTNKKHGEY
jgi:ribonuclease HI